MRLIEKSRNVHLLDIEVNKRSYTLNIAMLSDLHWDNPKCDRAFLKKHLELCLKNDWRIHLNGDIFCLMQGKYDPRKDKGSIRPEHNVSNYLDAVVDTASDWFLPYVHLIDVVGYGNHECYREDTEVLTKRGWINIKDVTTGDMVATFDEKTIYFESPNELVSKQVNKLVHIKSTYSNQIVSGKHAVVLNDLTKVNAEDIEGLKDKDLPHGMMLDCYSEYSTDVVRLLTCVVMDATLVDHRKYVPETTKRRVQFKLSKPEKIEYIKSVLDSNGISYTFAECKKTGLNKLQPYYIRVYGDHARAIFDLLDEVKKLPDDFKYLNKENYNAFKDALINTDGYKSSSIIEWNTTSKEDIDVVQQMVMFNGEFMTFSTIEGASGFKNGKTQYRSRISPQIFKNRNAKITHEDGDFTVYCLSMPSGRFITRIDGKVAYSGNTNIIKRMETDPLQRFVDLLNSKANIDHKVYTGGYGGWYVIRIDNHLYRIRYYHGSGGGGVVTKGAINLTRSKEMYDNFDCFTMGHVHENTERYDTVSSIDLKHRPFDKELLLMITGTYKEEYDDGYMGWHVERGAPPKPIGGRLLTLEYHRDDKGKVIKATSKKLQ